MTSEQKTSGAVEIGLALPSLERGPDYRSGFIAVVGPANAGKSTLVNALVGAKVSIVSPKEQTTRNRVTGIKSTAEGQVIFVDTPGFLARKYRGELARFLGDALTSSCEGVDAVMLVCDAERIQKENGFVRRLAESVKQKRIQAPAIIVLNKIDVTDRLKLLPMIEEINQVFQGAIGGQAVQIVPISAKKGDGIDALLKLVLQLLPPGPALFPEDMVSDDSEEFLASEIIREKLFYNLHQEIPYSTAVKIEAWDEKPELSHIRAVIVVEKDNQKGIVIGSGGEKLKAIGTSARKELERVFGSKVFLELFVRVEPNWTRTASGMSRVGYGGMRPNSGVVNGS